MNALTRVLRYSAAAVIIAMCATAAQAQLPESEHKKMGKKWEEKFNKVIKDLKLSPEQQKAITEQRAQDKANFQALREKTRALRDEIGKELDKADTDPAKVASLMAQMKDIAGERIEQQIKGILAMKKILTAEQFKKLNDEIKPRGEHRRGGGP